MKRQTITTIIAAGLILGSASFGFAKTVTMSEVPEAVKRTITDQKITDAKGIKIQRETEKGRNVYQVQFKEKGKNTVLKLAEDGTIISDNRNNRSDANSGIHLPVIGTHKTKFSDLPVAVQNTIRAEGGTGAIEDVDRETKDGRTVYKVEIQRDGKNTKLQVAEDGTVIKDNRDNRKTELKEGTIVTDSAGAEVKVKTSERTKFENLPAAVQKTIREQGGSNKIEDVDKETKDGRTVYHVNIQREGKNTKLQIADDGTILKDNRTK